MHNTLLVGVDLEHGDRFVSTEIGRDATATIEQAISFAQHVQAELVLCAVLPISDQAEHLIEIDVQNLQRTVEDLAVEVLASLVASVTAQGVRARGIVKIGHPAEVLAHVAAEIGASMIFVGTHAHGRIARLLFGSTAQSLMRLATCPVWSVKPGEVREMREVLVASDLSPACARTVQFGIDIARALDARLFLAHCLEIPVESYMRSAGIDEDELARIRREATAEAQRKLEAQLANADVRTVQQGAKCEVVSGSPDEVLPELTKLHEIDVVVIGTQRRSGLTAMLLGNTAERLLPTLPASVVSVDLHAADVRS